MPWYVWVLIGVAVVIGLLVLNVSVGSGRRMFKFLMADVQPIDQVQLGEIVRIRGEAVPIDGATLTAPVTQRPMVAYRLMCKYVRGDSGSEWRTARTEIVDFAIDDGSGLAQIVGAGADFHIEGELELFEHEYEWKFEGRSEMPDWVMEVAREVDLETANDAGAWRIREVGIEPGETVSAFGEASLGSLPHLIELRSTADHQLMITDRPDLVK